MEIDFVGPARIDDALIVRTTYDDIVGARMMISQSITRGGALIVRAAVQAACIAPSRGARRPPNDLVARIRPHLSARQAP